VPRPSPDFLPPSKLQWAQELPRALYGLASLPASRRVLLDAPVGDGRPVMLLPGLFNSDRANGLMRGYLRRLGYDARGWGLGRNFGTRTIGVEGERFLTALEKFSSESDAPVTLIGISLGGIIARFAAHRRPELVREVITIASPFAGDPRATNVWRAFELFTGDRVDSAHVAARRVEVAAPLPVPATAIWSRDDGLVNGNICHDPADTTLHSIEVRSGHVGVQTRPAVLLAVAQVLGKQRPQSSTLDLRQVT